MTCVRDIGIDHLGHLQWFLLVLDTHINHGPRLNRDKNNQEAYEKSSQHGQILTLFP
jgi:hypothetical protein